MDKLNDILSSLNSSNQLVLKKQQIDALICLSEKKDVVAVLLTGYGKSVVCTVYPLLLDQVSDINQCTGWNNF
jgi:superfamily II DNA helicase RecQ